MTLLFMDGAKLSQTSDLLKRWTAGTNAAIAATGRISSPCLSVQDSNGWLYKIFGGTASTIIVGFAHYMPNGLGRTICGFYEAASGLHVEMGTDGAGHIIVLRAGTTLATSTATVTLNVWNHYQLKVKVHDTLGTVDVVLNGVSVISATGLDTRNGGTGIVDTLYIGKTAGTAFGATQNTGYYDDLWICDNAGAQNNDFLGDCRIEALVPTGAGAHTDFTPSTGSNWQNVDERPSNGDTDYNSSATAGNIDTFVMADLSTVSGTVRAVQYVPYHRKDDAGSRTVAPVARISGTDYVGTAQAVTDTYTYAPAEIKELSPASGVAWTIAEINAAEFGYKLVS